MSRTRKPAKKATPADFPALQQFFSGYLHQDFVEEYGSASGAAEAYVRDADTTDLRQLRSEWKIWRASLQDVSASGLAAELRKLGAAWAPASIRALDVVGDAFG